MQGIVGRELRPGAECETDEELLEGAKRVAESIYHPVGTCKMGPDSDPNAVVDARLKVRGTVGLRVADGSIMPTITSGNTNAPTMMVAEMASRFLRDDTWPHAWRAMTEH